jgi:hypothetical protein
MDHAAFFSLSHDLPPSARLRMAMRRSGWRWKMEHVFAVQVLRIRPRPTPREAAVISRSVNHAPRRRIACSLAKDLT